MMTKYKGEGTAPGHCAVEGVAGPGQAGSLGTSVSVNVHI